jgi:hypothetical protein
MSPRNYPLCVTVSGWSFYNAMKEFSANKGFNIDSHENTDDDDDDDGFILSFPMRPDRHVIRSLDCESE